MAEQEPMTQEPTRTQDHDELNAGPPCRLGLDAARQAGSAALAGAASWL